MREDNRTSQRIAIDRQVMLHSKETGNRLVIARMRDLSNSGMLIEAQEATQLSLKSEVRAAFRVDNGISIVPSVVVRNSANQYALHFTKRPPETERLINKLIDEQAQPNCNILDYSQYLSQPDWR